MQSGGPARPEPVLLQLGQVSAGKNRPCHDRCCCHQGAGRPGWGASEGGGSLGWCRGKQCRERHQTPAGMASSSVWMVAGRGWGGGGGDRYVKKCFSSLSKKAERFRRWKFSSRRFWFVVRCQLFWSPFIRTAQQV